MQHTTITKEEHPWPRRDPHPQPNPPLTQPNYILPSSSEQTFTYTFLKKSMFFTAVFPNLCETAAR
jgi:hypothetical protein